MSGPRSTDLGDQTQWAIAALAAFGILAFTVVWAGGTFGAGLAGYGWDAPPFALSTASTLISRGPTALWPGAPAAVLYAGMFGMLALIAVPAALAVNFVLDRGKAPKGLAGKRELAAMCPAGIEARARELRPTLKGREELHPDETGNLLGDLDPKGPELRSSYEDVELDLMAPRAGKSTGIAVPRVLRAQGAVLLTSNKSDVYAVTRAQREKAGTVWTFDPQGIAHAPRAMWWNILGECHTIEGARRMAGHFVASVNDDTAKKDFWISAAQNTLTALFLAAARGRAPLTELLAWLADPADRTPIDLLREVGLVAMAEQLQGTVRGAVETRDGIYETARQTASCLLDPEILAWVTPDPELPEFRPHEHVLSTDTLYLLSKDGGGSAAGVIAGLADATMRAGVVAAERMGGRLDPPLTAVLDEAANVCRISDLPDLYPLRLARHQRRDPAPELPPGRPRVGRRRHGRAVERGDHQSSAPDWTTRLVQKIPPWSASTTCRPRAFRASTARPAPTHRQSPSCRPTGSAPCPRTALLLATGVKPALIRPRPWYKEPGAAEISQAGEGGDGGHHGTRSGSPAAGSGPDPGEGERRGPGGLPERRPA
ncbi:TraD/TraG TraM recognition site domain-containing protein OS=Streptomyces griseorubiginosus OX=67304 GN=DWG14_07438 PE=4 SV=1 [Streptomyces griseorubiginosus]